MNNGYSGTGISIIFYLLLALVMPLVHFVRVVLRHNGYKHRFVFRHFLYGIMIIATVVVGISWLTDVTGMKELAHWHVMLYVSAATTVGLLLVWILLPLLVRLLLWIFRVTPTTLPTEPVSHTRVKPRRAHEEHRVIDGIMSRNQWVAFRTIHYGGPKSSKYRRGHTINYIG
jgi:hypothetical protein